MNTAETVENAARPVEPVAGTAEEARAGEARHMDFAAYIARHGTLVYRTRGRSMLPLLRENRDLVVIAPTAGRLKPLDVALYRRPGNRYVLHRVIRVREKDYVIRGDNCAVTERGVTDGDILGVMTALIRDGRRISVTDRGYRLYARLWCALYGPRRLLRKAARAVRLCGRACKRVLRGGGESGHET